ncbi:hypothetical protein G7Z17_g4033 [Cylindrodendrum hubeiense]|uniref:Zn(2)-C6 fungal-type domain-containing protein n=1 Tax=Cylindrodendrum hubeiense TaxID=595255 RepID=A0A9P5HGR2_9HYPO|nr:hypothetical protein G7Z17_g4033 [Cylindrodendrum hubeiense]
MQSDTEHADAPSPDDDSRPAKRKRVALACHSCRERKVRCDGSKPLCGPCEKRGEDPSNCSYTVLASSAKQVSEQEYIASLQSQVRDLQQVVSHLRQHAEASSSQGGQCPVSNDSVEESAMSPGCDDEDEGPVTTSSVENTIPDRRSPQTNDQSLRTEHHAFPPALDTGEAPGGPSPISAMGATIALKAANNREYIRRIPWDDITPAPSHLQPV